MRKKMNRQMCLTQAPIDHVHARELSAMDEILTGMGSVLGSIRKDLSQGRSFRRGREGMTADQVLRALILKQLNCYSYTGLHFHLSDSVSYRAFCYLGVFGKTPSRSTLQENIKKIQPATIERLHKAIIGCAIDVEMEDGRKSRIDCTVTESNIHEPSDSSLLWDVVRKLTIELRKARSHGAKTSNHSRVAKRRFIAIQNAGNMERRVPLYRDLLKTAVNSCEEALQISAWLETKKTKTKRVQKIIAALCKFEELGRRVIDQTERRVLQKKSVPAREKVVSIFEEHTDIIIKGCREVEYGHKICLSSGASGLILDCVVEDGNPADVTLATEMIERQKVLFGKVPEQVAFDGGFASRSNLADLKNLGVKDVAFSKRCGMKITEMVQSETVYRALRHFRAGIEGTISFLKRVVGLDRCTWRSRTLFQVYVLSSVATANQLMLARYKLAT